MTEVKMPKIEYFELSEWIRLIKLSEISSALCTVSRLNKKKEVITDQLIEMNVRKSITIIFIKRVSLKKDVQPALNSVSQTACVETDAGFTSCARLLSAKRETCFPDRMLLQPCIMKFIFVSVSDFKCCVYNADPSGRTV
jgi:hypothetical protein